ncbi:MAG: sigma 54-interacting transcriptional regulator [Deltaproteobacteria bacterium]|nr:sigma 54-interacting transcriptional regulator [Deltaproteobacteria bacterium]MBW2152283.1 sigma 54-interacting transcriptional regulator [Deltaproteobacteria bacterium]
MEKPEDGRCGSGSSFLNQPGTSCTLTSLPSSHCCTILESIREGVFTIDSNKKIIYLNPAAEAITGFTGKEAKGQYCFDIFRADICENECPMDKVLAGKNPEPNPHVSIITQAGKKKPISIYFSVLKDESGRVIGGVEVFSDLSKFEQLRRQLTKSYTHEDIIGVHPKMKEILSMLPDIAESESPVLVEGPTGSGKELIARAVHNLSPRKNGAFIPVNCAALPDTLLESELFGFAKGAFTGAVKSKVGRFKLADRGTLFLDEIGNTSESFQADLLRVLENGEYIPLGDTRPVKTNFRVVAATNAELKNRVQEGRFREDLYYRLCVAKISLPPLKERKEDIPLLIHHFIQKFNLRKRKAIQGVSPEVLSFLMAHSFPGNIRELENIIEYAFIFCKGETIEMWHLPQDLIEGAGGNDSMDLNEEEQNEAWRIRLLLQRYPRNRQLVARSLGISRTSLWRKMKKYGLLTSSS